MGNSETMLLEGVAAWRTVRFQAQEAACGRGFESGSARHIRGMQSQNVGVAGKERNSRIGHSLAGLVVGYLQMEAPKGLVNSSLKEGRENLYHRSLSITHLKSSQRGAIQHMGFEVRLQVQISAT